MGAWMLPPIKITFRCLLITSNAVIIISQERQPTSEAPRKKRANKDRDPNCETPWEPSVFD